MKRLLREPLLHFVLLGGLVFLLQPWWQALGSPAIIVVSAGDQQRLRSLWLNQTGRLPSAVEMSALLQQHVDEELLLQEARRLGLQRHDPVVRQRLIRNMRFAEQAAGADDESLLQAALTLGMVESDLVIRRRLIQRMRHRIESEVQVSETEARRYFDQQMADFRPMPRYSFQQVYFENAGPGDIQAALKALQSGSLANSIGDPFLPGQQFEHRSPAEIERQLGSDIAQLISAAKPGEWFGPVISVYGKHLIRVNAIETAARPAYELLQYPLAAELYSRKESQSLRAAINALRSRYRLLIEDSSS